MAYKTLVLILPQRSLSLLRDEELVFYCITRNFPVKFLMMYKRSFKKPHYSSLLFGPRGTGKSTWISQHFPKTTLYNLLDTKEQLRLSKAPSLFYQEVKALPKKSWVVIDEIQKVPALLDEIHRLIEEDGYQFLLSGSSARKLKRGASNLLAGRAISLQMLPFCSKEVDTKNIDKVLKYGLLPKAYLLEKPTSFLKTYVNTYLKEEVLAEALTRNIGAFNRFLEIAARQNGQLTNLSNLARDAEVKRPSVDGYFSVLIDTLIGYWLPAWSINSSTKQVDHPKFYFFDTGVVRALAGRLPYDMTSEEKGPLLETWILHELRCLILYNELYYQLFFWRNHNGQEVDIVFEGKKFFYAIEIKAAPNWKPEFNKGLNSFKDKFVQQKSVKKPLKRMGIYTGERKAKIGDIEVFPVHDFLDFLWSSDL